MYTKDDRIDLKSNRKDNFWNKRQFIKHKSNKPKGFIQCETEGTQIAILEIPPCNQHP